MSALDTETRAAINAETAAFLLDAAQLTKGPDADAQTVGAIGAGYAILAAADRMDMLMESLEALAVTVDGLAAAVDAMAAPRLTLWGRLTGWARTLTGNAVRAAEQVAEATEAQAPAQDTEATDDAHSAAGGAVVLGPWAGVRS